MIVPILQFLLLHWPSALGMTFLAYLLSNRFNNGLNKYPGPFLASLTNWWRFWIVYKKRPEVEHIRLHEKHGDIVRLGPNNLSFSNPQALKEIYGLNKGFTKSEFYPVQQAAAKGHRLPSLFSTTSEAFHAQLRRSVSSAFSMSTLIQYEPFVDSTTKLFLSQTEALYASTGTACNFSRWFQFYAFDVIGEMTYSKRHGFVQENKDIEGIVGYVSWLFDYAAPIGQIPILDLLLLKNPLYLLLSRLGFIDATFAVAKFAQARMVERYPLTISKDGGQVLPVTSDTPKNSKADLLSKFVQAKTDRPDFMTDSLVITMATSMAFAGSETTAISLSSVFYYLLKTPECMEKLYSELDTKSREGYFQDNEEGLVTWTESQGLPYLDACIKEAFRLHPAPGLLLERVVPREGKEICGELIKGGTIVGCSAWVLHRRRDVFGEDVEVFRPERWLIGEGREMNGKGREVEEKRIKDMGATMLHFGAGSRTCIGKNISLLEIYKLVPTLLRRFEVRLQDPTKEWTIHNAWFVRQLDFNTTFHPREIVQPTGVGT